ncbi:hypothetical protein GQ607_006327 [Colletotrichum asianum]|uniref:Uncharacterized protein n=1 Tax=Colletotrichum asianum TaxID=702518 RepID=A0A8H3WIH5_9PEZI|nr:hypothetical protein GQ607_006327 [Colletotrichum asianum]
MSPSLSLSPGVPSGVVLISLPPLLLVPAWISPAFQPRQASTRETRTTQASPTRLTNHAIASSVHRHSPAQRRDTYCYQHHASLQLCLASLQTTSQTSQFAASSPSQRKAGQRLGRLGNLGGLGCRYQAPSACILRHGDRAPYAMLCIPSLTLD